MLLVLATATLYSPVGRHPFISYDDPGYVSENEHVQGGLSAETISWALTATEQANWHPLTWISHALDFELYGLSPGGHHVTNVILHALNSLLLFWILARTTGEQWPSAFVAAAFALHPVNVESVSWIAERKNVLSSFFFFLSLGVYGWYARLPDWRRYCMLLAVFLCGLASKAMLVTLPLVLLLVDYWPLGRIQGTSAPPRSFRVQRTTWNTLMVEKLPLLVLSLVSSVVTVLAQRSGRAVESLGALPLRMRVGNAVYSYVMYIGKIFWPANLAVVYPHPLNKLSLFEVLACGLLLVVITVFAWTERLRRPYFLIGWLWFVGMLVPVIGLVQVGAQGMADRYTYLPAIGIFVALVWSLADWTKRWPIKPVVLAGAATAILIALSAVTFRQIRYWDNSFDLWTHTLAVTDDNFIADDALGNLLLREGNPEALRYFEAAARLAPWDPVSHGAVAANLQDRGDLEGAIDEYKIALRANPDAKFQAYALTNMGVIYREQGNYSLARESTERALRIEPKAVDEMINQLAQVVAAHPAAAGYVRLGNLLEGVGRTSEARLAYQTALRLDPTLSPVGRADEAVSK